MELLRLQIFESDTLEMKYTVWHYSYDRDIDRGVESEIRFSLCRDANDGDDLH